MNTTLKQPHTTENTAPPPPSGAPERLPQVPAAVDAESPVTTAQSVGRPPVTPPPSPIKPMEKGRFAVGLLLGSAGITLLLSVAVGMLQQLGLNGWFSLPVVALTAIAGVMMLGGGFGLMATAAAGFDDGEFDRLMEAGNISSVSSDELPDSNVETSVTPTDNDSGEVHATDVE